MASSEHDGKIIYIGSYAKVLGPSLRAGYIVADKLFIDRAIAFRKLIDFTGDFVIQESVSRLIDTGGYNGLINKERRIYAERLNLTINLLSSELNEEIHFTTPKGGMAVWIDFNIKYAIQKISNKTKSYNLYFNESLLQYQYSNLNSLRLGFASFNDDELRKVIFILKDIIKKINGCYKYTAI